MNNNAAAAQALATTLAGTDYMWRTDGAPKAKRSDEIAGMVDILSFMQAGMCVACGDALDGAIQLCHLVASRRSGYGIMALNVYVGHVGCNSDDYKEYGDIVPLSSLVRGDLIPSELPTRKESLKRYAELQNVREARRNRRAQLAK